MDVARHLKFNMVKASLKFPSYEERDQNTPEIKKKTNKDMGRPTVLLSAEGMWGCR